MTAATALEVITANLELLREATRTDAAFHIHLEPETGMFAEIQVARGMLRHRNPEQLHGQGLENFPWLKSRLASLRVSELRDTAKPPRRSRRGTPPPGAILASGRC